MSQPQKKGGATPKRSVQHRKVNLELSLLVIQFTAPLLCQFNMPTKPRLQRAVPTGPVPLTRMQQNLASDRHPKITAASTWKLPSHMLGAPSSATMKMKGPGFHCGLLVLHWQERLDCRSNPGRAACPITNEFTSFVKFKKALTLQQSAGRDSV